MDDDGSKSLCMSEFRKAMVEMRFHDLTDADIRHMFNYFDRDGDGTISFDEFILGVREPMNERRRRLVRMAFEKMDKDGNGLLEPSDIVDTFDASKHPAVMSGQMTHEQVFREFLDNFDVGGEKDGVVTPQEWENYYANVSSSIDNDDYFELMIRNAWRLSGGTGWCANSANRRVMVTHTDGRQTVEEIRDDLGVRPDQYGARLREQGVYTAAKLDTQGGLGDSNGGGGPSLSQTYASRPQTAARTVNPNHRTTALW